MRACVAFLAVLVAGCSGSPGSGSETGGEAQVVLDGKSYAVRDVSLTLDAGEEPWFRLEGEPVADADLDCVPGLSGGMGLYGDLPSAVRAPTDLIGRRLKVDFSGDGDDANFCFVGMGGLAGAEEAWVTIDAVSGDRVTFSMAGSFKIYDENGEGPVKRATAAGTATFRPPS